MIHLPDKDKAKRLLHFFSESGYTQTQIRDRIGLRELPSRRLGNLPYLLERTGEPSTLHILLRWFFVGVPVSAKSAKELISPEILELLFEAGLLAASSDHFVSSVMMAPFENYLIASDQMLKAESEDRSDLVLWPNPSSWLLSRFTVRKPFESVLDMGSGCGMQAFSAATHATDVIGVDLNERATAFAQFNARLNGIENVEFLTGDSFTPVKDRNFDLIVSNPPFFIGPQNEDMYCDNPLELDQYCRFVAREGASHLEDNGFLQMVCEWVELRDQPWQERITEWIEGTGCDAWVLKGYSEDPLHYAHKRIQERSPGSGPDRDATYLEHIKYHKRLGVVSIHGGLIVLHRRSGANWIRWSELGASPKEPFGDAIFRCFENRDFLHATADEQLLDCKPRLSSDARLLGESRQENQGWKSTSLRLQLTSGIPASTGIQPLVSAFVAQFDGSQSVRELVAGLAENVGVSRTQVEQECLTVTRKLMEDGFLLV